MGGCRLECAAVFACISGESCPAGANDELEAVYSMRELRVSRPLRFM